MQLSGDLGSGAVVSSAGLNQAPDNALAAMLPGERVSVTVSIPPGFPAESATDADMGGTAVTSTSQRTSAQIRRGLPLRQATGNLTEKARNV